jgi:hypothetical protein
LFGAVTRVAAIPGVSPRIFSTLRATASVRCSEAAGGSCTFSMK